MDDLFPDPTPKKKRTPRKRKHTTAPKIPGLPYIPISASHPNFHGWLPLHENQHFLDSLSEELRTLVIEQKVKFGTEIIHLARKLVTSRQERLPK